MSEQLQTQEQETEETTVEQGFTETTETEQTSTTGQKGSPGRPLSTAAQTAQDVAVSLAEAGETFTVDKVQQESGASKAVTRNRLNALVNQGVLKQSKGAQRQEGRGRPTSTFEKA